MEWRPVRGYEGFYEASNTGHIRSLDRFVGARGGSARRVRGQELTPRVRDSGTYAVNLWKDGVCHQVPVRRIILETFDQPRPPGMDAENIDRNPANNKVSNLRWKTDYQMRAIELLCERLLG